MRMSITEAKPVYYELVIVAASPATEIWLGDDDGHFVQKEIGTLRTSLLPGHPTKWRRLGRYFHGLCRAGNSTNSVQRADEKTHKMG